MRRTVSADLTVRTPDEHDRQRCSSCGAYVLDGFEAGHADDHFKNRDAVRPVFTPVEAVDVEHDPAAREGGGLKFSQPTDPKIREIR